MIKAIFFDIDGTLRDFTEIGIRPGTYQAIALARANHIRCFVATGRHLVEIQEEGLLGRLEFDGYVLLNGSLCLDDKLSCLYANPIPVSQIQAMLALHKELGYPPGLSDGSLQRRPAAGLTRRPSSPVRYHLLARSRRL